MASDSNEQTFLTELSSNPDRDTTRFVPMFSNLPGIEGDVIGGICFSLPGTITNTGNPTPTPTSVC